eukprot:TRINITY_DN74577_c0_g1_i1.p2 TRINITY_DN74577_c0_g1~~TRINITY_DN74577_c0_g1_i1.p2  ORF type:complete len:112 (-),score=12.70 TRINITY_DN74577_c0_g1_i1:82-417(-)
MFNYSLWNKHNEILAGEILNTNASEGYNCALQRASPKDANIWQMIQVVRREEADVLKKMSDAVKGTKKKSNRKRARQREHRHRQLATLVGNYGKMKIRDFMNEAVTFYNYI